MIDILSTPVDSSLFYLAVPNPAPAVPEGLQGPVNQVISYAKWIVMSLGMLGILYCAGQMIMGRRNRHQMSADGAMGIPWVIGGISLLAIGAPLINSFL
ncbi:hypothetical protein [Nocardiopsis sp. NRRL B-16309]|uniref:hypothetical protein n=1 Tax=Nocardiopsis sp. NRRL B-16309 TaxID=1519494 RepID=UPI0006AF05F2|nr:hypothetical protein [Nocardiopsis sp. NRRL B-16309]KOX13691.1 hypothetical protein ADL05_18595 [Nocardiopsis sp. NRRL B-16309]